MKFVNFQNVSNVVTSQKTTEKMFFSILVNGLPAERWGPLRFALAPLVHAKRLLIKIMRNQSSRHFRNISVFLAGKMAPPLAETHAVLNAALLRTLDVSPFALSASCLSMRVCCASRVEPRAALALYLGEEPPAHCRGQGCRQQ